MCVTTDVLFKNIPFVLTIASMCFFHDTNVQGYYCVFFKFAEELQWMSQGM